MPKYRVEINVSVMPDEAQMIDEPFVAVAVFENLTQEGLMKIGSAAIIETLAIHAIAIGGK